MITSLDIGYNGRLGNQLFQYAVCYNIAKRLNVDFVIPKKNVDNIKTDGCFDYSNNKWLPYRFRMYDCFNITAPKLDSIHVNNIFNEPYFQYSDTINTITDSTSIQGYYQSEKYFLESKGDILKEFTFKSNIMDSSKNILEEFNNNEVVAIHIRRGDNIINPVFPLISLEYIQNALNLFTDKEYNFLIISDDINWCKNIFPNDENIKFSDSNNDFIDLCLMSLANHNIISNSSFSWWGAYLNSNPDKKVIAPLDWFKNKNIDTKDLYCDNWIIL